MILLVLSYNLYIEICVLNQKPETENSLGHVGFLYNQDLPHNSYICWRAYLDRRHNRKRWRRELLPALTDGFRYPSVFVQVAEEQAVDKCGLPEA
jgi:hypothetical protein